MVKGQTCIIQGTVPGSLAVEEYGSNEKYFVIMGQALGPYTVIMNTPNQVALSTITVKESEEHLQALLEEFVDVFQVPKGLPPPRLHDHRISLKDESVVIKV